MKTKVPRAHASHSGALTFGRAGQAAGEEIETEAHNWVAQGPRAIGCWSWDLYRGQPCPQNPVCGLVVFFGSSIKPPCSSRGSFRFPGSNGQKFDRHPSALPCPQEGCPLHTMGFLT